MPKIFLCLPAYNEEKSLPPLFKEIQEALKGYDYQVIAVNDGSMDNTKSILENHEDSLPLQIIDHPENRGLGEAIKSGLKAAAQKADDNDIIVTMDADNTHPPEHIPDMMNEITHGADIVIASRYRKGSKQYGVPLFRRFLSLGARIVFSITLHLPNVRDYTCGYRAFKAALIKEALQKYGENIITREGFACTDELLVNLASLTHNIKEVPFILHYDRKAGASKLQLFKTIRATLKMLLSKKK